MSEDNSSFDEIPEIIEARRLAEEKQQAIKTFFDKANDMLGAWIAENIFSFLPPDLWKMPVLGDYVLVAEISDVDDGASVIAKWHSNNIKRHQLIGLLDAATQSFSSN